MTSFSRDIVLFKQKRKWVDQNLNTELVEDHLWFGKVFNW